MDLAHKMAQCGGKWIHLWKLTHSLGTIYFVTWFKAWPKTPGLWWQPGSSCTSEERHIVSPHVSVTQHMWTVTASAFWHLSSTSPHRDEPPALPPSLWNTTAILPTVRNLLRGAFITGHWLLNQEVCPCQLVVPACQQGIMPLTPFPTPTSSIEL